MKFEDSSYKVTVTFGDELIFTIKIFRVSNQDAFNIDFTNKYGGIIQFFEKYDEIKKHINLKFGYQEDNDD